MTTEGQTFAGESLLVRYVNFVKLPHTLFALPFALLGVLAASMTTPVTVRTVALVVVAFSAARWAAMGFNRLADRDYDARNPRTANRELPRGALTPAQAWLSVTAAAAVFVGAAALLNPLCLLLSPVALGWVLLYSLSKRFTWWPHLWLGTESRDRAGRRLSRGDRPLERARVAAACRDPRRGDLGGGIRHLLRAAGRGIRSRGGTAERRGPTGSGPRDPAREAPARGDHSGAGAVRLGGGLRPLVFRRPRGGRGRSSPTSISW